MAEQNITTEDWIEFKNNATKYLEMHSQYATRKIIQIAIEKQIPKEPIIVHPLQENDSGEFACPICKTGALVKRIDKFCWSCGQAIKWE